MHAIAPRQGSSTAQPSETQETTQATESSPTETRTTPTRTASASQTQPNTSSRERTTSSRGQSTTENVTASSAQETTTSSPDNTSAPPTSTSDQPTSASNLQTSSSESQTSETISSQTPTESATTTPQSTAESVTSQDSFTLPSATSSVPDISTSTPISSLSSPTSRTFLPTFTTGTAGSSTPAPSTTTPGSGFNSIATTPQASSLNSEPGTTSSVTSVVVTVVSSINGVPTTFTTLVPTLATSPNGSSRLSARTTSIVRGVIGGTLALLGILLALFYISRRRRKLAAVRNNPRLQAPRQMLDEDDFDLAEPPGPAPYAYGVVGARVNPNASGSIFHEDLPGTAAHHWHTHSRSVASENDPLLVQHIRGGYPDAESIATTSPRESAHFRASSTSGLLYDPSDPFGDGRSEGGSSLRVNPLVLAKAREAQPQVSDPHAYPPSSYHGPRFNPEMFPMLPVGSNVLVHQDAGRIYASNTEETPPSYANVERPSRNP